MNGKYSKRVQRILEEGKKCKPKCYGYIGPTGPTGPTGQSGATTITVGTTTTGNPGTEASVVNSGTLENVVLDFTIPQGPTGPAGESPTAVYGRKYDTTENDITLQPNIAQNIPLGSDGPVSGITTGTQNFLTITTDGVYKVDYYFSGSSSANTELTVQVKQNTTPIGSTTITKNVNANVENDFIGSTINSFTAGDQIGLEIESTNSATITPTTGTSTYLNIIKIS